MTVDPRRGQVETKALVGDGTRWEAMEVERVVPSKGEPLAMFSGAVILGFGLGAKNAFPAAGVKIPAKSRPWPQRLPGACPVGSPAFADHPAARQLLGHDGKSNIVYDESGTLYCYDRVSKPMVRHRMLYIGYEPERETIKYPCSARHEGRSCPHDSVCNKARWASFAWDQSKKRWPNEPQPEAAGQLNA